MQRLWEERQVCCGRQTDAGAPGTGHGWCCGGCGEGGRLSYLSRRPIPPHVFQGTSTTRHAPTRYPEEGFAGKDLKLENVFAYTPPPCFLLSLSFTCQPYPSLLTPLIKSWLCVLLPQSGNIIVVGVIMIELKNHSTTCADGVPRQSEVRVIVVEC